MSSTAPPHVGPADRIDFTDSRVLVTGGTKGIGAAITRHFVEADASVIVAARTPVDDIPAGRFAQADVATSEGVTTLAVSDQYEQEMEYSGDVAKGEFTAFWLRDGRVLAGMNVNIWDVTDVIQTLIRSGARGDKARLVNPEVPPAEVHTEPLAGARS